MALDLENSCAIGPLVPKDLLIERIGTWQWHDYKALIKLQFDFINTQGTKVADIIDVHEAIKSHVTGSLRNYLANFEVPQFGIQTLPVAFNEVMETALLFGLIDLGTYKELGGKLNMTKAPMGFILPNQHEKPRGRSPMDTLPCPDEYPGANASVKEMASLVISMDLDPLTLRSFMTGTDAAYMRQASASGNALEPIYTVGDYLYLKELISTRRYNYLADICNAGFNIPNDALKDEFAVVSDVLHPVLISRSNGPLVGPVDPCQVIFSPRFNNNEFD